MNRSRLCRNQSFARRAKCSRSAWRSCGKAVSDCWYEEQSSRGGESFSFSESTFGELCLCSENEMHRSFAALRMTWCRSAGVPKPETRNSYSRRQRIVFLVCLVAFLTLAWVLVLRCAFGIRLAFRRLAARIALLQPRFLRLTAVLGVFAGFGVISIVPFDGWIFRAVGKLTFHRRVGFLRRTVLFD